MYQYFAFNIIYSLIIFISLYSLKTAPFRIRFRLVLLAMISWLLPYDLINNFLVQGDTGRFSATISSFNNDIKHVIVSQINNETYLSLIIFVKTMTFVGFIWFMKDLASLRIKLRKLNKKTSYYRNINGIEIYKTNNDEIFTVGIIKPKIYIGDKYFNSPLIDSIINHELQHIKSSDQLWLLFITLIQRLLWWNPIVYLLAHKGRELIELSCDQACKEQSTDNQYQKDLAQILIKTNQHSNPLSSHFFGKAQLNVFRIKQLSKEFKMHKKHKAIIFSTAFIPLILTMLVSTTSVSSEQRIVESKGKKTVLAKDEVDVSLKAILTVPAQRKGVDTQSIEARMINEFNKPSKLKAGEPGFSLVVETTPKKVNDNQVLIDINISFEINGENIKKQLALLVLNNKEASIIIKDENHSLEIKILPRFLS